MLAAAAEAMITMMVVSATTTAQHPNKTQLYLSDMNACGIAMICILLTVAFQTGAILSRLQRSPNHATFEIPPGPARHGPRQDL